MCTPRRWNGTRSRPNARPGAPTPGPNPCACPPGPRRQLSHNYAPDGRRVNPQGGTYWIPPHEYEWAIARAQYDPTVLNLYRFEPLPTGPAVSPPCPPCPPYPRRQ